MTCVLCAQPLVIGQRRFCSKRCNDRWRATVPSKAFTCPECGTTVLVPANKLSRRKFCTRACATGAFNKKNLRGARNGNWKGGRALYYGQDWKAIKALVRKRDGVCMACGKTSEKNGRALDVHHIHPFRFSGNNSAENLVALCHSCHMRADDHGRAGSVKFLRDLTPKRPTKREIRRLRQLIREAERRARRRENQRAAAEMSAAGASLREISRALGVSHETVSRWLKGYYKVLERAVRYEVHRPRTRSRPLGRPLLSCPSLRPGSSVGRARV